MMHEIIKDRIKDNGPISFRDFMAAALYEPGAGYYTSASTEIGKHGDFYTSPHAHPIFGAMMARQAQECWDAMGRPQKFEIVECGGGKGWLAKDLLDYLRLREKDLYAALAYTLVELNPGMRQAQEELLSQHKDKIAWATHIQHTAPISGLILSNELIDAFPVHLLQWHEEWREVFVTLQDDELAETLMPIEDDTLAQYLAQYLPEVPEGYRTEINLEARKWIANASHALNKGFIITIDYGYPAGEYYDPERSRGTLLCYKDHQTNEDYLSDIGHQDLTAHVNFTDICRRGIEHGLTPIGFARQGIYLVSLGIDEVVTELYGEVPDMGREAHMLQNLIMPGTMGDTHKVLLQQKGVRLDTPRGYRMKNEAGKLA